MDPQEQNLRPSDRIARFLNIPVEQLQPAAIFATVGPLELETGTVYIHEAALDGDEHLHVGKHVQLRDDAGRNWTATVTGRNGDRWQLTLDR